MSSVKVSNIKKFIRKYTRCSKQVCGFVVLIVAFYILWGHPVAEAAGVMIPVLALLLGVAGTFMAITIPLMANFSDFESSYEISIFKIYAKINDGYSILLLMRNFFIGFLVIGVSLFFVSGENLIYRTIALSVAIWFIFRIYADFYEAMKLITNIVSSDSYYELLLKKWKALYTNKAKDPDLEQINIYITQIYLCHRFRIKNKAETYEPRDEYSIKNWFKEEGNKEIPHLEKFNNDRITLSIRYIRLIRVAETSLSRVKYNDFVTIIVRWIRDEVLSSDDSYPFVDIIRTFYLVAFEQVQADVIPRKNIATRVLLPVYTYPFSLSKIGSYYTECFSVYEQLAGNCPEVIVHYHRALLLSSNSEVVNRLAHKHRVNINLYDYRTVKYILENFDEKVVDFFPEAKNQEEKLIIKNILLQRLNYNCQLRMLLFSMAKMASLANLSPILKIYNAHSPFQSTGHNVGFRLIPKNPVELLIFDIGSMIIFGDAMDMGQSKHYCNHVIGLYVLYYVFRYQIIGCKLPQDNLTIQSIDIALGKVPGVENFIKTGSWCIEFKKFFQLEDEGIEMLKNNALEYLNSANGGLAGKKSTIQSSGTLSEYAFNRFHTEILAAEQKTLEDKKNFPLFSNLETDSICDDHKLITRNDTVSRSAFLPDTGVHYVFRGRGVILRRLHMQAAHGKLKNYGVAIDSIEPAKFNLEKEEILFITIQDKPLLEELFSQDISSDIIFLPDGRQIQLFYIHGAESTGKYWLYSPSKAPPIFGLEETFDIVLKTDFEEISAQKSSDITLKSEYRIAVLDKNIYSYISWGYNWSVSN